MSLKQELQTWSDALVAYDQQDWDLCIELFETIADSSKIMFNIGIIQATTGAHEQAVQSFEAAIGMDSYLAVAYFQSGVSNFLLGQYEAARRDFEDTYSYLRSNSTIDYEQLGLKFRLYSCEVLFNRGLSAIYTGQESEGLADLQLALKEKQTDVHSVIDDAYADRGDGYTVFSIPVGVLYRPSETKLKNLKTKNYLGAAKLVAATDTRDAFVGFTGSALAANVGNAFGDDGKGAGSLARSKTSAARIEGGAGARATQPLRRTATESPQTALGRTPAPMGRSKSVAKPLGRSNTLPGNAGVGIGAPRKPGAGRLPTPPPSDEIDRLPLPTGMASQRDTAYGGADFVNAYYDEEAPPLPPLPRNAGPTPAGQPIERVANWARQNVGSDPPVQSLSRSTSASEKGVGLGGGVVGKMTQSRPREQGRGFAGSQRGYGEDGYEEGYAATVMTSQTEREMNKVRVKLRFQDDTRGMSILPELAYEDFVERVRIKFNSPSDLPMKYRDSDGAFVTLLDADDWESAIDEAREASKGRAEGKLEIWVH